MIMIMILLMNKLNMISIEGLKNLKTKLKGGIHLKMVRLNMYRVKRPSVLVVLLQGISEGATDERARLARQAETSQK